MTAFDEPETQRQKVRRLCVHFMTLDRQKENVPSEDRWKFDMLYSGAAMALAVEAMYFVWTTPEEPTARVP